MPTDSRARLLASSSNRSIRSPRSWYFRRRSSINQRLDILGIDTSTPRSLSSRVCRPVPLALALFLLTIVVVAVYFTHAAITTKAREWHDQVEQAVLHKSLWAAQKVQEVVNDSTDVVTNALTPITSIDEQDTTKPVV